MTGSNDDRSFPSVPWIGWTAYISTDKSNPDKLQLKVDETSTFETDLSTAVKVLLKKGKEWLPHNLPLKSNNSNNDKLLRLWNTNIEKGRLKAGTVFTLVTYKRPSKKSKWMLREYEMQIS